MAIFASESLYSRFAIDHRSAWLDDQDAPLFTQLPDDAISGMAATMEPEAGAPRQTWLRGYDAYYYDRTGYRPLPVLRLDYADAAQTLVRVHTKQSDRDMTFIITDQGEIVIVPLVA